MLPGPGAHVMCDGTARMRADPLQQHGKMEASSNQRDKHKSWLQSFSN